MPGPLRARCNRGMFVADEVRVPVSAAAAAARLAALARAGSLDGVSQAAWHDGITRVGPMPGLSKLVRIRFREPVRRGAVTVLTLRWEAAGPVGALFPVLDADITLVPDGGRATLLGLDGVYRPPGGSLGAALDQALLHRVAAATIRALLARIAGAITNHNDNHPSEPALDGRARIPGEHGVSS